MSRILLDENVPVGLSRLLPDHEVRHVRDEGWKGISNGELIAVAEKVGYDALITADKNLSYQQNLSERRIALIVIGSNNWNDVQRHLAGIEKAVERIEVGSYREVLFERARGRGRGPQGYER
jgi:predicted nuclease of predicted toxin-antitoxin system